MLTTTRHGVELVLDDSSFDVAPWVYRPALDDGWYEEKFLEHILAAGRHGTYVDVGAHLGTATAPEPRISLSRWPTDCVHPSNDQNLWMALGGVR